jgi:addiction module RelB/DinJ family antitoxin
MSSINTIKKTKVIQTRLDADIVDKADEILDYIGLTTTDLIRLMLKKLVNTGQIPISLEYENPYFTKEQSKIVDESLADVEKGKVRGFESIEELNSFVDGL